MTGTIGVVDVWHLIEPILRAAMVHGDQGARRAAAALGDALLRQHQREQGDVLPGVDVGPGWCARRLWTLMDSASDGGNHPLAVLYRKGTIGAGELRAAQEILWAVEVASAGGARAMDPGKVKVDGGGRVWQTLSGVSAPEWSAVHRVQRWVALERQQQPLGKLSRADVAGLVLVQGVGTRAVERMAGVKTGAAVKALKEGLERYAALRGPALDGVPAPT